MTIILCLFGIFGENVLAQKPCVQKAYRGPDNPMNCVCNATYCDEIPPLGTLNAGQAAIYTSSQSGKRFYRQTLSFDSSLFPNVIKITANDTQKKQNIIGFGGAFTDASGINIAKLSPGAQQNLISSYYGPNGIGYTLGRTPMASCDFSTHIYSYDDVDGDFNLTNFALTQEDYNYKIPFLKMAQNLLGDKLKLFASPWSAPGWMKVTGKMNAGGPLKGPIDGPYFQTWANYFVRYFEEYAKNGVTYWGATMQNEPGVASDYNWKWQAMWFNSSMERDYAKGLWGKTLRANPTTAKLNLMVLDHNRDMVIDYSNTIFGDSEAYAMVDGLAVHWYEDNLAQNPPSLLTQVHNNFPGKWMLYTEACNGGPYLGDWGQGDNYAHSITTVLQNWVGGWTDWNIALDPLGGPNWLNNFVDSPIIVSNNSDQFEKQPMYYVLGHFAKFIVPDSTIIGLDLDGVTNQNFEGVAALTPSGQNVIVLNNRDVATTYAVSIMNKQGAPLNLNLEPRSLTTVVYSD